MILTIRLCALQIYFFVACALIHIGWFSATTASAAIGDLYVSDFSNGVVLKLSPTGTSSTFASGLTGPFGLAFDRAGNLFVADKNTNSVFKFTPAGVRSTFASGLNVPTALAFDATGNLFVANFGANTILKFAPDGSRVTFASGLSNPSGLAFDVAGNLYESDYASGMMFKFTPSGTKTMFASGLGHPEEIAFDLGGNLLVGEFSTGSIYKFDPVGAKSTFASGLSGSWGLAFNSAGDLFEADSTSGMVLKFTPQGAQTTFANGIGVPTFLTFEPPTGIPLNISTRMRVLSDDSVLIAGFIIAGTEPKKVLIRGIGPSLGNSGLEGVLADPTLELHQDGTTLATNDNWKINDQTQQSQESDIRATTIPPTNDLESAIVINLNPGAYTAILSGKSGGTGVGLVEVYDLAQAVNSELANISSRGFVDTGDNVMIGGFIVGGGSGNGARVMIRAIGPSLSGSGVSGALQDPTLELRDGNGSLLVFNDNWKIRSDGSSQRAEIEATTISPSNDLEAALVQPLVPGNYTAIVRGKNSTTGVALVEVYNLQ